MVPYLMFLSLVYKGKAAESCNHILFFKKAIIKIIYFELKFSIIL